MRARATTSPARPGLLMALGLALLVALGLTMPALAEAQSKPAGKGQAPVGIDVSRFNGEINWQRVARSRVEFAFIQASRGDGVRCPVAPLSCGPDERYRENLRRAARAGVHVGAYHRAFVHGRTRRQAQNHARKEARVFVRRVGNLRHHRLRPVLDVETPFTGVTQRRLRVWLATWLRLVERQLGARPIIYTNWSSWQATGNVESFARNGYPLWVAQWNVREPLVPANDWAGRGWEIWQYSSTGRVPGVEGDVDLNRLKTGYARIRVR